MGKFKVGDRVRALVGCGSVKQGEIHTVRHLDNEGEVWLTQDADGDYVDYFTDDELELIPATPPLNITISTRYVTRSGKVTGPVTKGDAGFEAIVDGSVRVFDKAGGAVFGSGDDIVEAWAPKVGERVRFVRDSTAGGAWYGCKGETATVVAHGPTSVEKPFTTVTLDGGEARISFNPSAYLSDIEPLPVAAEAQPAALKIEAGRYYKTRDGRKVGPMEKFYEDGRCFGSSGAMTGGLWKPDGSAWFDGAEDSPALIALWQDEHAAKASNDNAKPPKFKVGDSVRLGGWLPGYYEVIKIEGEHFWIKAGGLPDLKYRIDTGDWIVLPSAETTTQPTAIVTLIENGTAKPATKPKVHTSQADATAEAERLALANPGQEFGVFVLADSKIADIVTTQTAVLRAA